MVYSTGRGGAGNIHESKDLTSEHNHKPHEPEPLSALTSPQDHTNKKVFYSTGRGGAGNIKSLDSIPSPKLVPQGSNTPQLSSSKVTTGRGGYGNMINNDNPELVRKLQDVDGKDHDDLYAVASNKSFSVGRGGFGNVISKTRSTSSNKSNGLERNLYAISSRGEKKKKRGFFDKIKEAFN